MKLIRVNAWGRVWQNIDKRKARKLYDMGGTIAATDATFNPLCSFVNVPRYSKASTCGMDFDRLYKSLLYYSMSNRIRWFAPVAEIVAGKER